MIDDAVSFFGDIWWFFFYINRNICSRTIGCEIVLVKEQCKMDMTKYSRAPLLRAPLLHRFGYKAVGR